MVTSPMSQAFKRLLMAGTGTSLVELLFVAALMVTLTGLAVPAILAGLDDARAGAAARYLAGQARLARMQAVTRSARVALRFQEDGASYRYAVYVDGNANGVRTADITRGIDRMLRPAERIGDQFPGVRFGIAAGVKPITRGGTERPGSDPIRLGRSNILTFSPSGTTTSGTLYVCGRTGRQYAVRILGATGRTRVLEFNFGAGTWIQR